MYSSLPLFVLIYRHDDSMSQKDGKRHGGEDSSLVEGKEEAVALRLRQQNSFHASSGFFKCVCHRMFGHVLHENNPGSFDGITANTSTRAKTWYLCLQLLVKFVERCSACVRQHLLKIWQELSHRLREHIQLSWLLACTLP